MKYFWIGVNNYFKELSFKEEIEVILSFVLSSGILSSTVLSSLILSNVKD